MYIKKSGVTAFSLLLLSAIAAVAIFEILLRIMHYGDYPIFESNEIYGYLMRPSQDVYSYGHPIIINKHGLRGPDFSKEKSEGVLRLLYIGDSITYGGGRIREEDLFCRVSEALLREDNRAVEVINISAPGWSPQNWIEYIKYNGLFDADFVAVFLPECDLARPFSTLDMHKLKEKRPLLRMQSVFLKLYYMLSVYLNNQTSAFNNEPTTNIDANIAAIHELIDLCGAQRTQLLIVYIPSFPPSEYARFWPMFETAIDGPVLDLRDKLNSEALFLDGHHLSKEGHRIVGELLYTYLRSTLHQKISLRSNPRKASEIAHGSL